MRFIAAGLGNFGIHWATTIARNESTQLAAVVEPDPERRLWAAAQLGLTPERCFAGIDDALANVDCDAVLVITTPETHLAVATAALRSGKHVLTEKPLTPTLAEARAAIAEADRAGCVLMVSQNYRFRPQARTIRALVAAGEIGEIVSASLHCQRDWRTAYEPGNYRYQMRHPWIIDMSIHHFDLMRALTGLEVRSIAATSWRVPDSPFVHHPAAAAQVIFANGAPLVYEASGATYRPLTSWNGDWEIVGERGRIIWTGGVDDPERGVFHIQRWGEPLREVAVDHSGPQGRDLVLSLFWEAIASGTEPETSARDNIKSLALVMACAAAIDHGTVVDLASYLSAEGELTETGPA